MKKVLFFLFLVLFSPNAEACHFGSPISGNKCQGFLTTGTVSWSVPADWSNASNSIEVLGEGGNGSLYSGSHAGAGGGGGGYAKAVSQTLSGSYTVQIGAGGTGNPTYFNSTSFLEATAGVTPVLSNLLVAGGSGSGSASSVTHSGGSSGASGSGANDGQGGGGGGAAGGAGVGGNGAAGSTVGGGGGGGNGGTNASGGTAGSGATNGGTGGTGSGGAGGAGNIGTNWDASHGSGGGGAGGFINTSGGNGGNYGAGGGGEGKTDTSFGSGAPGLIIITYTPVPPSIFINNAKIRNAKLGI